MPKLGAFVCILLLASPPRGTAQAAAAARADLEAQGWISLAELAERLRVSPWELRQWVDTNVPAGHMAKSPVWTRSAWVPLVYVSPEAAEAAERRFHPGRHAAVPGAEGGPWPDGDGALAPAATGFDLALLGTLLFPSESRLGTSAGADLALRYRFNEHVAIGIDGGFLRVDTDSGGAWLGPMADAPPADFDLFPVGLSLLLETDVAPRLGVGITGGVRSLLSDDEPTFPNPGSSSVIGADLDDGLAASLLLHLHARIGAHWRLVIEGGYQFDIERPELSCDFIGPTGLLRRDETEISMEGALLRCGLCFEL